MKRNRTPGVKAAQERYQKKLARVSLWWEPEFYQKVKNAAAAEGKSVNGFLKDLAMQHLNNKLK